MRSYNYLFLKFKKQVFLKTTLKLKNSRRNFRDI